MTSLAVELIAKKAAADVTKTKEDLIRLVLNKLLGEGQYTLDDIKDRGKFIEHTSTPGEQVFHFDGRDVIWFGKPHVHIHKGESGISYQIELPHEVLIMEKDLPLSTH